MITSKKVKVLLMTAILSLSLSVPLTVNASAYTPGTASYTAVSGDSLYKISQVFHTTVDNIMKSNNLKNISLNIGQILKVPGDTYTVVKGDTLFLIAQKYKIPLSELRRANNLYTDYLDIGQRLAMPVASSSGSSGTPSGGTSSGSAGGTGLADSTVSPSNNPAETAAYSAEDLDLLSRLIMAEAQGESYQAKVAVGAVVVNRVESGLFADSIKGVIYQNINGYYQFTPVANGWIDKPANADSINAAKDALNGADPTNGALWYYDDSTTNTFMLSKKVSVKIDHMVFAF